MRMRVYGLEQSTYSILKLPLYGVAKFGKKLRFFLKVQGNLLMIFLVFGKILNIFSKYFVIFKFSLLYYLEWSNIEKIF